MKAYELPGAQSASITRSDKSYHIDIWIPEGEAPIDGWPLILLLDGSVCFGTAVDAVRRMARRPDATGAGRCVIAGLSAESGYDVTQRERDYKGAGAESFLDFIAASLLPWIEAQARVNPQQTLLFGHSLGGYFTLLALVARPQLFRAYMAVSPSIWVDRDGLFTAASKIAVEDRDVALLVGGWETKLPPWQAALPGASEVQAKRRERDMAGAAREFAAHLTEFLPQGRVDFTLLDEEDHASILSAAIPRALRMLSRSSPRE